MTDQRVSVFDFFDDLWGNVPPAGNVPQEFRNIVDGVRRAMREEKNGP
jgi:hypothetical protein